MLSSHCGPWQCYYCTVQETKYHDSSKPLSSFKICIPWIYDISCKFLLPFYAWKKNIVFHILLWEGSLHSTYFVILGVNFIHGHMKFWAWLWPMGAIHCTWKLHYGQQVSYKKFGSFSQYLVTSCLTSSMQLATLGIKQYW